jgi:hypothetical protein
LYAGFHDIIGSDFVATVLATSDEALRGHLEEPRSLDGLEQLFELFDHADDYNPEFGAAVRNLFSELPARSTPDQLSNLQGRNALKALEDSYHHAIRNVVLSFAPEFPTLNMEHIASSIEKRLLRSVSSPRR